MSTDLSLFTAVELLPEPTLSPIARPLATQSGHTYAALWPYIRRPETDQPVERHLVFVRDDGLLHISGQSAPALPLRPPLPPSSLPARLPVPEDRLWSAAGVQAYQAGYRPDPLAVFQRLTRLLSHFVDFNGTLAESPVMAELFAAYLLTTWFSPAFPVLPLLWITGDRGAGKSRLLHLLAQLSYLGLVLPVLPPLEPLCDLAALGASLALDDAHDLSAQLSPTPSWPRRSPYAVLVAGRQRGPLLPVTYAALGVPGRTRQLDVSGPRLFASARQPHPALAGYCLAVSLYRTSNAALSARDPLDPAEWLAADPALPPAPLAAFLILFFSPSPVARFWPRPKVPVPSWLWKGSGDGGRFAAANAQGLGTSAPCQVK